MKLTNATIVDAQPALESLLSPERDLPVKLGYALDITMDDLGPTLQSIRERRQEILDRHTEEEVPCIADEETGEIIRDLDEGEELTEENELVAPNGETIDLPEGQTATKRREFGDLDALNDELEELMEEETEIGVHQVSIDYLAEKDFHLKNFERRPISFLFTTGDPSA